jgi:GR25 family glycosyltransferase involved in LPS biosynthesis
MSEDKSLKYEDFIDGIMFINLIDRTDRLKKILEECNKVEIPLEMIHRIEAVLDKTCGHLGCSKSHIMTLQKFIDSNYERCLVFEDDFEFIEAKPHLASYFRDLINAEKNGLKWDVILFAANDVDSTSTNYPFLKKITNAQTTAGYMVSKDYAPTLLKNFQEGVAKLEEAYKKNETDPGGSYAVDQYWKLLQKTGNWYLFQPKIGKQRESYSDIQKGVMNYGV